MPQIHHEVCVIGAGLAGISFARFFLETHPGCDLIILEKDSSVGGVWNKSRAFDDFLTQSPSRMNYFSDVEIKLSESVLGPYDTFGSKHVSTYLEEYVNSHVYDGLSLRDRIQLNTAVQSISKEDGRWLVQSQGEKAKSLRCNKLVVASGLTSLPNMPNIPSNPDFKAPLLHHRDFGSRSTEILAGSSPYKRIAVLGGGKSGADMVYAAVKAGKHVSWIIRRNGEGPGIFMHPAAPERYKHAAEMGLTRAAVTLNPSCYKQPTWWAKMIFETEAGASILQERIFATDRRAKAYANYGGRESARPGYKDLEPEASFFWMNGPIGAMQHTDFYDLVSQKVDVHRGEVSGTAAGAIILHDGTAIKTDLVLCGTGWNAAYPFISEATAAALGIPHEPTTDSAEARREWAELEATADKQILESYPILKQAPPAKSISRAEKLTPARLYHSIAPLTDDSIAFLGRSRMYTNWMSGEVQAIWLTALWDGHVKLPARKQAMRDVAYMNVFSRRRYLARGADGVNFHKDLIWYADKLLQEAGLSSHRKAWWDDWQEPFLAKDLRDLKDEYMAKYGVKRT